MLADQLDYVIGVDPHRDTHALEACGQTGRHLIIAGRYHDVEGRAGLAQSRHDGRGDGARADEAQPHRVVSAHVSLCRAARHAGSRAQCAYSSRILKPRVGKSIAGRERILRIGTVVRYAG